MADLAIGARGSFEVFADGRRVFSKLEAGRFPEDQEVLDLIEGG